jgi:hypothetical protein
MKAVILAISTGLMLAGCAAPAETDAVEATVDTTEDAKPIPIQQAKETMNAESEFTQIKMWQKTPGTSVYNAVGQVVDNLRLFPSVTVFEVQDISGETWARIDETQDKWVKLSDLASEKSDGMIERPIDSNGMDRIDREALKRAVETGVRPGEQN